MRTKKRLPFYLFGTVLSFVLLFSCEEKPDFIGKDLLPSGDNFIVLFDSMEVIQGYAKHADSIPSGFKDNFLLGSIVDPFFGISKAEIITTITPSINSRGFGVNARADSVILFVSLGDLAGEGSLPLHLSLYEYTEYILIDSSYYTNMDITGKYRDQELGSESIPVGDTILKIFITDPDFIEKFLTAEDSMLRDRDNLQELMNGLYFTSNDAFDEGGIVKINFDDTQNYLYFYYGNDSVSGQNQYYSFESGYNRRINLFKHSPGGYPLEEYLNNGSGNDSLLFVQSMAGVSSVIQFPGLNKWVDSMPIAINEARLIIPMADTGFTMQNRIYFPDDLSLYVIQEDGRYNLSYDQILDETFYGGHYDSENNSYSFTMKVQMQSILNDSTKNLDMILIPGGTSTSITRAVLNGWSSDPQKRIRLEITYTKL